MKRISITECPRDAMQGISSFIPTDTKVNYLNQLLKVGFDVLDFGSFVSPKAIPQLADTAQVLEHLDLSGPTKLLAIVANVRGAEQAVSYSSIDYLGFPLSVSETFQQRNTGKDISKAFQEVLEMRDLCSKHDKTLRVYLSMAFGNPYGDDYTTDAVLEMTLKLSEAGITEIALADTIGSSNRDLIGELWGALKGQFPHLDLIAHLHSNPNSAQDKIEAALQAGCTRFDTALLGYGGCPMAKDDLTGNLATEALVKKAQELGYTIGLDNEAYQSSITAATQLFSLY